jgi:hypothetical protein
VNSFQISAVAVERINCKRGENAENRRKSINFLFVFLIFFIGIHLIPRHFFHFSTIFLILHFSILLPPVAFLRLAPTGALVRLDLALLDRPQVNGLL